MTRKAKAADVDGEKRARKLGEGKEIISVELSPSEVADEEHHVMELLARKDNLLAASKSLQAEYKAKVGIIDGQIEVARRVASAKRRDLEVDVEHWLSPTNEVMRVRTDTGEILGRRAARADELQEIMFVDSAADEVFGNGTS